MPAGREPCCGSVAPVLNPAALYELAARALPRGYVKKQARAEAAEALGRRAAVEVDEDAARGVVEAGFVDALLKRHLREHPGYYGEMIWILMMMEQWFRAHRPDHRMAA